MAYTLDVVPANFLYLDIFPGSVFTGGPEKPSIGDEYRVIVTDNTFYVLHDTFDGPQSLIQEPLVSFEGSNKLGYTVVTETETYHVQRATNCGCGSRLRGVHPFIGVPYISQIRQN